MTAAGRIQADQAARIKPALQALTRVIRRTKGATAGNHACVVADLHLITQELAGVIICEADAAQYRWSWEFIGGWGLDPEMLHAALDGAGRHVYLAVDGLRDYRDMPGGPGQDASLLTRRSHQAWTATRTLDGTIRQPHGYTHAQVPQHALIIAALREASGALHSALHAESEAIRPVHGRAPATALARASVTCQEARARLTPVARAVTKDVALWRSRSRPRRDTTRSFT
jgi:hypothetical protein